VTNRAAVDTNHDDDATDPTADETRAASASPPTPTRAGYADFLSRVAHDLRSPLGIVMHVVQKFETELEASLTDEQRVLTRLGGRSVRRLRDFVEKVTLLSVLEGDELQPNLQTVGLAELAKRSIVACQEAEPRSSVSISFEGPAHCAVTGDPSLISAILAELLRNAVAHARRSVRVGVVAEPSSTSLFVEDDGPGISEAAAATLFARFIARQSRGGLGVGLSMARDLSRAMSGDLRLEQSRLPPGRPGTVGARVVLVLPKPG
jgi:signal transduction histidine kinase